MVYTYTPTYYSSFQDTITSLCKSILPFGLRSRRPLPDQKLAKRQSDSLKWQQDSFHRILHLIGLRKEGMVPEAEVAAFRIHLLDTLIAAPAEPEPAGIVRDKLLFLQELFYSKCISAREYHSSKRPLLQRLAAQGVELQFRDVVVEDPAMSLDEEWSVIDLRDKEPPSVPQADAKPTAHIKAFISNAASWKGKGKKISSNSSSKGPLGSLDINSMEDTAAKASTKKSSVLMPESSPMAPPIKSKRKQFKALFQKDDHYNENLEPLVSEAKNIQKPAAAKKQWGFDGLKKWNRSTSKDADESKIPTIGEASAVNCTLVASPIGDGSNANKRMDSNNVELKSKNFADEQKMEMISNKVPFEKTDLRDNNLPKSWCQEYGDTVHGGMETVRKERDELITIADKWVAFVEEEEEEKEKNCADRRNLFAEEQPLSSKEKMIRNSSTGEDDPFLNNPFYELSLQ